MSENNPLGTWAKIIIVVTSIMGLSALALLAAGAAFTAVLVQTPQDKQFPTFIVMAGLVLALVLANMIYAYLIQKLELTFRVRVAHLENGMESPWENMQVDLYKNGKFDQSSSTDEMGMLVFTVKLERKDELYVVVVDETGKKSNKGVLFSGGQCQMIKTIRC